MNKNSELLKKLESCPWARCIGEPDSLANTCGTIEQIAHKLEAQADEFLQSPYDNPYEFLCVLDHESASRLARKVDPHRVSAVAKRAFLTTWGTVPVSEICCIVSDDADTLATLLLADSELATFTKERLDWYLSGRIPFGYIGPYPDGKWLIL